MTFMHGLLMSGDESVSQDQPSDAAMCCICGIQSAPLDHSRVHGLPCMASIFRSPCFIVSLICPPLIMQWRPLATFILEVSILFSCAASDDDFHAWLADGK